MRPMMIPSAARADVELTSSKKEGARRDTMAMPQAVQKD